MAHCLKGFTLAGQTYVNPESLKSSMYFHYKFSYSSQVLDHTPLGGLYLNSAWYLVSAQ